MARGGGGDWTLKMPALIPRYNRSQIIKAVLYLAGGSICYLLTWLFFRHFPPYIARKLANGMEDGTATIVAILCMAAVTANGYRTWRMGGGLQNYFESGFFARLEESTGGAVIMNRHIARVTNTAFVVSQTALAGPLLVLRAWAAMRSRIIDRENLETRLQQTLEALREAGRWQALEDHEDNQEVILLLARMGHLYFSENRGHPRFKAK